MIFSLRHNLVLMALLLGACATPPPPVVTMMGTKAHGDTTTIAARSGDNIYLMSERLGVDLRALIDQNHLTPPYNLTPGQILHVPAPETVSVHRGDTLFSIAQAYKVDQSELVRLNALQAPYDLPENKLLKLPTPVVPAAVQTVMASDNQQLIFTPPVEPAKTTIVEEDLAPLTATDKPVETASLPSPAATSIAKTTPAPAAVKPAATKPVLGTGVPKFSWPSNGSTLSDFGPKEGGRHNDGINIGAPLGSPVRAAAGGEVVYTGDNVAGFGNLILVRHSGGFATAYAHVQNPLIKRGQSVTAGQAIAQIGKTGNVSTPQLHFEIRKGTKPVDPKGFLP